MNQYFVLAQGAAQPQSAAPVKTQTATTPAQPGKAPEQQGGAFGGIMGMLPMILIIAAMFWLMWRGQAKERKKREAMLSSIKAGDKVITIGGLCGVVVEVRADGYLIKFADNVKIEVTKTAVGSVVAPANGDVPAK